MAYLTAIMNSSLFKYCFRDSFPELQGGTREMSKIFFDKIPIPLPTEEIETKCAQLVADIQNSYSKSKALVLDELIFDIYGLTSEERHIIGFVEIR